MQQNVLMLSVKKTDTEFCCGQLPPKIKDCKLVVLTSSVVLRSVSSLYATGSNLSLASLTLLCLGRG